MAQQFSPVVVDLSHYDVIQSNGFDALSRGGYKGVINKATQGYGAVDVTYAQRRTACIDSGLAYGAYAFGDSTDPVAQCDHFLAVAQPDDSTLLALDWEPNGAHTMSVSQARTFLDRLMEKTGRKPSDIYVYGSYAFLNDNIKSADDLAYFGQFRLWLACYSAKTRLPKAWDAYTLLQYTGDGQGPSPHDAPGVTIAGGVDNNVVCDGFDWNRDWGKAPALIAKPALPDPQTATVADLAPLSRKLSLIGWVKTFFGFGGVSATGLTLTDATQKAKGLSDVLHSLAADRDLVLAVVICLTVVVVGAVLEVWHLQDYRNGNWKPSGAA